MLHWKIPGHTLRHCAWELYTDSHKYLQLLHDPLLSKYSYCLQVLLTAATTSWTKTKYATSTSMQANLQIQKLKSKKVNCSVEQTIVKLVRPKVSTAIFHDLAISIATTCTMSRYRQTMFFSLVLPSVLQHVLLIDTLTLCSCILIHTDGSESSMRRSIMRGGTF